MHVRAEQICNIDRSGDVQVFVRETTVEPHIRMPFTDPAKDVDVSAQMAAWGVVEMGITHVRTSVMHSWQHALQSHARSAAV